MRFHRLWFFPPFTKFLPVVTLYFVILWHISFSSLRCSDFVVCHVDHNYWRKEPRRYEILALPPARHGRASLRDPEMWAGGEWAGAVKPNSPYVVKGVKVHGQRMNEAPPPPQRPVSVLFSLPSLPVSWTITVGQKSPSLTSAVLHNENKWSGSKYAGCVLFAALFQSSHWLSPTMKMDCVAESCPALFLSKAQSEAEDLTCTLDARAFIFAVAFSFWGKKLGWSNLLNGISSIISRSTETVHKLFL